MSNTREKVKCNLVPSLRRFWRLPLEGDIFGELLYVGQEVDGDDPYSCAYVIVEDGRVIGVDPTNLVFIREKKQVETYKDAK